ncbi:hypothetical protein [Paraburkholderia sp. SOS3]|uniref:hypothetical protein n=1 Tax=Paraburkholderia sp. SOS3 TaxID=1926494 RepID=UPI0012EB9651|nr:hypothetical protein [Paraburkholderia sp. SOS3]
MFILFRPRGFDAPLAFVNPVGKPDGRQFGRDVGSNLAAGRRRALIAHFAQHYPRFAARSIFALRNMNDS